jgi:hypothetical protein
MDAGGNCPYWGYGALKGRLRPARAVMGVVKQEQPLHLAEGTWRDLQK